MLNLENTPDPNPADATQVSLLDAALDELEQLIDWIGWSTAPLVDMGGQVTISFANTVHVDEFLSIVAGRPSDSPGSLYQAVLQSELDLEGGWGLCAVVVDDAHLCGHPGARPGIRLEVAIAMPHKDLGVVIDRLRDRATWLRR